VSSTGPVRRAEDPRRGQLGQQPPDRLVQREQSLLDEEESRSAGDRLGHRGDPEHRVALHRRPTDAEGALRLDRRPARVVDQRDQAGDAVVADLSPDGLGEPAHARAA
jgi:hypothetical protein